MSSSICCRSESSRIVSDRDLRTNAEVGWPMSELQADFDAKLTRALERGQTGAGCEDRAVRRPEIRIELVGEVPPEHGQMPRSICRTELDPCVDQGDWILLRNGIVGSGGPIAAPIGAIE